MNRIDRIAQAAKGYTGGKKYAGIEWLIEQGRLRPHDTLGQFNLIPAPIGRFPEKADGTLLVGR